MIEKRTLGCFDLNPWRLAALQNSSPSSNPVLGTEQQW